MEGIISIGRGFQKLVLWVASLLKNDASPGLVSLVLLVLLIAAIVLFWRQVVAQGRAVTWLMGLVAKTDSGFSTKIDVITATIKEEANTPQRQMVASAWLKYRETLVAHETDGETIQRNTVRPVQFFNAEDLGFSAGFWRILPGLFVSIGLFLTFLGLVAALNSMSEESINSDTMTALLSIASAKFIMSLTGLFCSIIFTVFLRRRLSVLDAAVHKLCAVIEKQLTFIGLEEIAVAQLSATREQREHFRMIGMELVAELGRPLREELPIAISSSISGAIAPLIERVQQSGVENINGMVKDLSTQFSEEVGNALTLASSSLSEAGIKISELSDRMDQSSGKMGSEMEAAIVRLSQTVDDLRNTMKLAAEDAGGTFTQGAEHLLAAMSNTLEGIRENTSEGARAISDAAKVMVDAAGSVRKEMTEAADKASEFAKQNIHRAAEVAGIAIDSAGQEVMKALEATTNEVTQSASVVSNKISQDILSPLGQVAEQLNSTVQVLKVGTDDLQKMSSGVRAGADASIKAASGFRAASEDLIAAVTPIRANSDKIESAIRLLSDSTTSTAQTVMKSAELTVQSASNALASAKEILGQEAKSIENALALVTQMLGRLEGQGDRLDDMDTKLGHAFEIYTTQVAQAVSGMRGHVVELQNRLNPALDTMREIVERAEEFSPQSRRV